MAIYIPKTINVGYRNRSDTYTGKLAYVIYYDESGKLRKETSWHNWRDKTIDNQEFDNVPTEGFVLNKKAGDYKSDWSHRRAYCRVYDPRNFEIEITIENLLFILENTNSFVGKGLEGEFVYSWDGKDLVLLPTSAPNYQDIKAQSRVVNKNNYIKPSELKEGHSYTDKNGNEYVYMGRHEYYPTTYINSTFTRHNYETASDIDNVKLKYWFKHKLWFDQYVSPSKKFISESEKPHPEYPDFYESMLSSCNYSPINKKEIRKYTLGEVGQLVKLALNDTMVSFLNVKSYAMYDLRKIDGNLIVSEFNRYWHPGKGLKIVNATELMDTFSPGYVIQYLENGKIYNSTKIIFEEKNNENTR
jgi:hypothetical protein